MLLTRIATAAVLVWWLKLPDYAEDLVFAPPAEQAFCAAVEEHRRAYRAASDLSAAGRAEREEAIWLAREETVARAVRDSGSRAAPEVLTSRHFTAQVDPTAGVDDWIGRVADIRLGLEIMGEGAAIDIVLPCRATLVQFGFASLGSSLFEQIQELKNGDRIVFSAAFLLPSPGFREGSAFEQAGASKWSRMIEPEYPLHLTKIAKQP